MSNNNAMSSLGSELIPNGKKMHFVMFPWLAFGHIIPFFELSKFIAQRGHKVSFISTPRNIRRLPKVPEHLRPSVALVEIPLPEVEGLPEHAEATMDVPTDDVDLLKKAYDGMEPQLTSFLENNIDANDIIVYDFAAHWLPPIASRLGTSHFFFCIFNAWFLAFLGTTDALINGLEDRTRAEDFLAPPGWITFETKVAYKLYEARWIVGAAGTNASGFSDTYRAGKVIEGTNAMIIRHCNEFEPQWLKLLEELHQIEVIPLGLMPSPVQDTWGGTNQGSVSIPDWLDNQKKGSVLYIALGSEVMLSKDQLNELALGVELSGVPFIWALRKPAGSTENDKIELPEEFEERTAGRGVVWKDWAPQLKILSHESVGAFLTHCGWSSIVEGLTFGLPLVLLPFLIDQGINARVLEDKKVGVEVPRNEQDGTYTRDDVAQTVRMVTVDDTGKEIRHTAKATGALFGDRKLNDQYLEDFVKYLENQQRSKC